VLTSKLHVDSEDTPANTPTQSAQISAEPPQQSCPAFCRHGILPPLI
jgi:hypothetical protein